MIIRLTLAGVESVERRIEDISNKAILIQQGSDKFLNEDAIELRKKFIDTYGDGYEVYLLIPSDFTADSILVESLGVINSEPVQKSNIVNSDDVEILYKRKRDR